jgi:propanediol dehydratase small subunit
MTTLADLKADIAEDIDDTTSEYLDQTQTAILAAIRYCERETYYFNQTRDETFDTAAAQEWYDETSNANIPTLVKIQRLYITDSGQITDLVRVTPDELEVLADTTSASGRPTCWAYFGQKIRLYPIPDSAYTIRMQLGPYRLTPLADDADTNAWLDEAYDMVKARAKYILGKNTLKDANLAAESLADYNDQHSSLKAETAMRQGRGYFTPTAF